MYFFSKFARCKSVNVLKELGQMCLRAKPIGIGNLLNGFLGEGQLLLNLVRRYSSMMALGAFPVMRRVT